MPSFTSSRDVIGQLRPRTYVNGGRFDALKCVSISFQPGSGGVKAEFEVPEYLFDTYRRRLSDGFVAVTILGTYDGSDNGYPDFLGYMDVDSATLSGDAVTLSASSITSFFGKVNIGDSDNEPVLTYPLVDPYNGEPTAWTPKRILDDILDRLPSRYKNRVALGDTAVLDKTQLFEIPEIEFRFESYAAALDKILALYGDVTFTESFRGGRAYLDFYRINAPGAAINRVRIAKWQDVVASGADVEDLSHDQSTSDAITRVKAYGTKRRYILSVLNYGPQPEGNLVKGWDPLLEAAVLKDPSSAKPGAPGYQPGMELVFRRWYLPSCLRPYLKLKDLGIKRQPVGDQEGPPYKVQVFKLPTILALDVSGNSVGTESVTGQLIKNAKMELDKGYFELGNVEDGINLTLIEPGDKKPKTTWAAAKVGITVCVEGNTWLVADTGASSSSGILYDIADDGLYDEPITRDDLTHLQITNIGRPITTPAGTEVEFGAYIFNEDTLAWVNYATEAVIMQDDTEKLMTLARETLRAKAKRHHAFNVTVPYYSKAFRPGNRLVVSGQRNWPSDRIVITGVDFDLANNSTSVTADNVKPPAVRQAQV